MKVIEVFKTTICKKREAKKVLSAIQKIDSTYKANFDLEDIDHILRIENPNGSIAIEKVTMLLQSFNHQCEILN